MNPSVIIDWRVVYRNFQWARCFKFNKHIEVIQFSYFNCSDRTVLGGRECDGLDFQTKKNETHRKQPIVCTAIIPSKAQNSCFFLEQKPIPHTPGALFYTHVHFHLTHVSLCLLEHIRLFFGGRLNTLLLKQTVKKCVKDFRKYY